jgi:polyribonucleotide nucleotidyltransferase
MERARQMVAAITAEAVVGETYTGTVKSVTAFGAFIEIMPGTEALLHVSEMRHHRVEKPEDIVKKGETVTVKLVERDERGRLRLSMKALLPKPEGTEAAAEGAPAEGGERPPRGDRPPRSGDRGGRGGRSRE